jgi:hypothetical protein
MCTGSAAAAAAAVGTVLLFCREFYCKICSKQYKTVGEMSNHLSSYDHHHKKRFDEMKKMQRGARSHETQKKRQKEKKREEAEMNKRMQAAGVKMGAPAQMPKPRPAGQSAPPTAAAPQTFSRQDIVRFYKTHDASKADEETAGYILGNYSTQQIVTNMQEKYGVAPTIGMQACTQQPSSGTAAASASSTAVATASAVPTADPAGGEELRCFTKEQLQEFYEIHDESKADEETAEYILDTFSTQEIVQKLSGQYGTAPKPKLVALPSSSCEEKETKRQRRLALMQQAKKANRFAPPR